MIKLEQTDVYGWEAAIRGMRNPMNSWDMSDSTFLPVYAPPAEYVPEIGESDLKLMKSLSKAGNDHGKFLRMINVTVDITAPLYWWKEFDTYKVGTVANSCSTMHKIHAKPFSLDDFSFDHITNEYVTYYNPATMIQKIVGCLNECRDKYLKTKDKQYWWQMIQLLPSSYNQKRTVQLNYQVLKQMYFARRNHKLDEWREFCAWCERLPYFREICIQE
jgi:hypothetical protein